MTKYYNIYFRRNNKERFWQAEKDMDLFSFRNLLDEMLEKTTEQKLEIKIIKTKKRA